MADLLALSGDREVPKGDSLEKAAIINAHAMRFIAALAGGWIRSGLSTRSNPKSALPQTATCPQHLEFQLDQSSLWGIMANSKNSLFGAELSTMSA